MFCKNSYDNAGKSVQCAPFEHLYSRLCTKRKINHSRTNQNNWIDNQKISHHSNDPRYLQNKNESLNEIIIFEEFSSIPRVNMILYIFKSRCDIVVYGEEVSPIIWHLVAVSFNWANTFSRKSASISSSRRISPQRFYIRETIKEKLWTN